MTSRRDESRRDGSADTAGDRPLVSAVIPSRGRPRLLSRAVASVAAQSYPNVEAVVVLDGCDAPEELASAWTRSGRLEVIRLPGPVGGSEARNVGIRASRGAWIALLDDDDAWEPDKLAVQMGVLADSDAAWPVASSQVTARTALGDYVWPRTSPTRPTNVPEFMFCHRASPFAGDRTLQTSTLVAPRELLLKVPFRADLPRHQDWDWLIRASALPGFALEFVERPLSVWSFEDRAGASVSSARGWEDSLRWFESVKAQLPPCAVRGYLVWHLARAMAKRRSFRNLQHYASQLARNGVWPAPREALYLAGVWLLSEAQRRHLRRWAYRRGERRKAGLPEGETERA